MLVGKDTFVMGSEPSPDLTADIVEKSIIEIKTEAEFAAVDNKAWWIKDRDP